MDLTPNTHEDSQHVLAPGDDFVFRDTAAMLRAAPYTEADRAIAEANIANAVSEGALLDEEILRARRSLEKLEQRRMSVRRFEYLERGFLSPIGTLPYEVLRHIFLLANEGGMYIYDDYPDIFPRVASQVCSYWRLVARSCAPLWTDVKVIHDSRINKYNPKYESLLEDCLNFSSSMPLSLHFGGDTTPMILGDRCVQALVRCATRWKHIVIREEKLTKAVFSSIPIDSTLEYLETLELQNLKDPVSISDAPKLKRLIVSGEIMGGRRNVRISIKSAPSVLHLNVQRIHRPSMTLTGIDWSKITVFEASDNIYQPEELVTILERMPNLVSLTIFGSTGATRTVNMPHLEEMTTGDWRFLETNAFDNITAPRLKKLSTTLRIDFSSLPEFVNRSRCNIEEIKLEREWIDACRDIPGLASVKTLFYDEPFDISDCFYYLTYRSGPSPDVAFTGLENLIITHLNGTPDRDSEWTMTEFIYMLKSRLRPYRNEVSTRTYLKSLRIEFFSGSLIDEFVAPLTEFINSELVRSSGVRIDVSVGDVKLSASD